MSGPNRCIVRLPLNSVKNHLGCTAQDSVLDCHASKSEVLFCSTVDKVEGCIQVWTSSKLLLGAIFLFVVPLHSPFFLQISYVLQPSNDGLHPSSDGFHPSSDSLQPNYVPQLRTCRFGPWVKPLGETSVEVSPELIPSSTRHNSIGGHRTDLCTCNCNARSP